MLVAATPLAAPSCPTAASAIDTDRPGVTNSATTVPRGSFQAENGSDWMAAHGSNFLTGSETRLRLGFAQCSEFLIDVPSYTGALSGSQPSGFSDVVVSFKRELPMPTGIHLSATAGLGFPSGSSKISGRGYQPYIQAPWSYRIGRVVSERDLHHVLVPERVGEKSDLWTGDFAGEKTGQLHQYGNRVRWNV
ncbi:MAG: hypothetical protein WBY93_03915 [Candidatus Binatus sp.]